MTKTWHFANLVRLRSERNSDLHIFEPDYSAQAIVGNTIESFPASIPRE